MRAALAMAVAAVITLFASDAWSNAEGGPIEENLVDIQVEVPKPRAGQPEVVLYIGETDAKAFGGVTVQPWQIMLAGLFLSLAVALVLGRPMSKRGRVGRVVAVGTAVSALLLVLAVACGGSKAEADEPLRTDFGPVDVPKGKQVRFQVIRTYESPGPSTLTIPASLCER